MTENEKSIETLRQNLKDAKTKKLGDQLLAFSDLIIHPNIELIDLLNGLEYPGVVAESAALNLHVLMRILRDERKVEMDRLFWENVLATAGAKQSIRIMDWVKADRDLAKAWEKCQKAVEIVR